MRRLLIVCTLLTLGVASAGAQNIGIFFDRAGASCSGTILPGTPTNLYVLAVRSGAITDGIVVAEFRITGMPAGWFTNLTANPAANIQLGDPLGPVGVDIAFPTCQTDPVVHLYTIQVLASSVVSDHYMKVARRNPPSNPNFQCPQWVRCDNPTFTMVCATGGQAIINPTGPGCTVAAEPSSWTKVKGLYDR